MAHAPGKGVVHVLAAGGQRGTAVIQIGAGNFGDNRVVEAGAQRPRDMGQGQSVEIAIAPVDELVHGPVRFLKIDTQGSEWLALEGARRLLEASPTWGS